jgi:predicted RNA-binding Zn ribbon-like protein
LENRKFEFISGSLCLDLANTVGGARNQANAIDHLTSYLDLLHWTHEAGLISEVELGNLHTKALNGFLPDANNVLTGVKKLREAIYRIFSNISIGEKVLDTDLLLLNEVIDHCYHRTRIVRTSEGYTWGWTKELTLDTMIAPIVRATADLLTTPSVLCRIQECASDACSWLFLDETKNRSRRWCNMKTCGNAHKVNRYRSRHTRNT